MRCSCIVTLTLWVVGGSGSAFAHELRGPDRPLDGPSVIITKDAIAINESRRLNWKRFWAKRRGYRVLRFKKSRLATLDLAALRQLKTKLRNLQQRRMGPMGRPGGGMNIMVGAGVPARTVAQVMIAATQEEFSSFVVLAPDASSPHGIRFDVPTMGGSLHPRHMDQQRERNGFGVTLWWRREAIHVLIQGVYTDGLPRLGTMRVSGRDEFEFDCKPVPFRFDGKCPALPHKLRRIDQERLMQFAQSMCGGKPPYQWLADLLVDAPFTDLFQASLIIYKVCGSRIVWTGSEPSWPTSCKDSVDLTQAQQRLRKGWCERTPVATSDAKTSIFD